MINHEISADVLEWSVEILSSLETANNAGFAVIANNKKVLYASSVLKPYLKNEPQKWILTPSINELFSIKSKKNLAYAGPLQIKNQSGRIVSFDAKVLSKNNSLLIQCSPSNSEPELQSRVDSKTESRLKDLEIQYSWTKEKLDDTTKALNASKKELLEIKNTKDKFVSIIGHDLKSPFNTIIGFSQILEEESQNLNYEEIERYAGMILESSKLSMNLLSNLMDWSKSQSGRMEFNKDTFEIGEFVKDLTPMYEGMAAQKSITINYSFKQKLMVSADKAMINTVFRNLISNAIKFTRQGGAIEISARKKNNEILVSVSDNGIGISKSNQKNLFLIENRISTTGTNLEKGTGMGLILCREFVEKNGGKIWAKSEEGKGSVFFFTLPLFE